MAKLNNSILTHGVSFPYGNRRLGIARIRRLQFIASPTFGYNSLAIKTERKLNSADIIDTLTDLFILRGVPAYMRSDNVPEFVAQAVRDWIAAVGAKTAYIEPGSP